jgi:hypothetical protein
MFLGIVSFLLFDLTHDIQCKDPIVHMNRSNHTMFLKCPYQIKYASLFQTCVALRISKPTFSGVILKFELRGRSLISELP